MLHKMTSNNSISTGLVLLTPTVYRWRRSYAPQCSFKLSYDLEYEQLSSNFQRPLNKNMHDDDDVVFLYVFLLSIV